MRDRWTGTLVIQPLKGRFSSGHVKLLHADGRDNLKIQKLPARGRELPDGSVLGVSQDFSLEASFQDALRRLDPESMRHANLVEVVSMGALYGGFSGFSRLFVRVDTSTYDLGKNLRSGEDKI
jgi:hypothetical protein